MISDSLLTQEGWAKLTQHQREEKKKELRMICRRWRDIPRAEYEKAKKMIEVLHSFNSFGRNRGFGRHSLSRKARRLREQEAKRCSASM